jgi:autotransporter-associated beta strand protein
VEVSPGEQWQRASFAGPVTFSRSGDTDSSLTVYFNVERTAGVGSYSVSAPGAASFTPPAGGLPGCVTIPAGQSEAIVDLDSAGGTLDLSLVGPNDGSYLLDNDSVADVLIGYCSPCVPTAEVSPGDQWITNAHSPAAVTISLEGTTGPAMVYFNLAEIGGGSYSVWANGASVDAPCGNSAGWISIPCGQTSAILEVSPGNVSSAAVDLSLAPGYGGYSLDDNSTATMFFGSAGPGPVVEVTPGEQLLTGLGASSPLTIMRGGDTSGPLTVDFSLGGTASSNDYTVWPECGMSFTAACGSIPGSFVIPAGQSSATVNIEAESIPNGDPSVDFQLLPIGGYTLDAASSAEVLLSNAPNNDLTWDATANGNTSNWASGLWQTYNRTVTTWIPGSDAVFPNGTGTVLVSSNISVGTIEFPSGGADIVSASAAGTLSLTGGQISVDSGIDTIAANIVSGSLTKSGNGMLILAGQNSYLGGTTIVGGTLQAGSSSAFGSGGLVVNGGGVDLNGYNLTVSDLTSNTASTGEVTNLSATSATLRVGGAAAQDFFYGALADQGAGGLGLTLLVPAAGGGDYDLYLGGNDDYSGVTTIGAAASGCVSLLACSPAALSPNSAVTIGYGSYLDLRGGNATIASLAGAGMVVNDSTGTVADLTVSGSANTTFSGQLLDMSDGGNIALTKSGSGTLTLSGSYNSFITAGVSAYSGGTAIEEGTLQAETAAALPGYSTANSVAVAPGAMLAVMVGGGDWTSSQLSSFLTQSPSPFGANSSLRINTTGGNFQYNGTIAGAISVVVFGGNTLTLSGDNGFTGGTTVNAATLVIGNPNALNSGALTMNGGTLDLNGFSSSFASLAGTGTIESGCGSPTLTIGDDDSDSTFSGSLVDAGGKLNLTKVGAGTLTLAGDNSYTGGTDVENGTLQLGSATALGSGPLTVNGGTLNLNGKSGSVGPLSGGGVITDDSAGSATTTLTVNETSGTTFSGVIDNGPNGAVLALNKSGPALLVLQGSNTLSGGIHVSAGVLYVSGSIAGQVTTSGSGQFGQPTAGNPLSLGSLSLSTYTNPVNGDSVNAFAGGTDFNGGAGLAVLSGTVSGAAPGSLVTLTVNWGSGPPQSYPVALGTGADTPFTLTDVYAQAQTLPISLLATSSDGWTASANSAATIADTGPEVNTSIVQVGSGLKFTAYTNEPGPFGPLTNQWSQGQTILGTGSSVVNNSSVNLAVTDQLGVALTEHGLSGGSTFTPDTPTLGITEIDPGGDVYDGLSAHFMVTLTGGLNAGDGSVTACYQAESGSGTGVANYNSTYGPNLLKFNYSYDTDTGDYSADFEQYYPAANMWISPQACAYDASTGVLSAVIAIPTTPNPAEQANTTFSLVLTNPYDPNSQYGGESIATVQTSATATILPWVINSTGNSSAEFPATSPWTGQDNLAGNPECTLPSMIQYLDANGGGKARFDIPDIIPYCINDVYTITPTTWLPAITQPITVDGSSQPGYSGTPIIDVDGVYGGFTVSAGPSIVQDVAVTNCSGSGVTIDDPGGNDNVNGCYIGLDPDGETVAGNLGYGVEIIDSSGNTLVKNVISANTSGGIHITGTDSVGNFVTDNYIGTNYQGTGSVGFGTQAAGVVIDGGAQLNAIGGAGTADENIIAGSIGSGIVIDGPGTNDNWVQSNFIYTNGGGVAITGGAQYNTINGAEIWGNLGTGVSIDGSNTNHNTVAGSSLVGNTGDGVGITGGAMLNTIGGTTTQSGNVIFGNGGNGVTITGTGTNSNIVAANFIGTNGGGTAAMPNAGDGVAIANGAQWNTIGGTESSDRNVISGNTGNGVSINGSQCTGNEIQGNYIGVRIDGMAALPNGADGVYLTGQANGNYVGVIGLDGPNGGNVISGNALSGLQISNGSYNNIVAGNLVGVASDGMTRLPNGSGNPSTAGVVMDSGAQKNLIGANCDGVSDAAEANVISGNIGCGVWISGTNTSSNRVAGNLIGTDKNGSLPLGNDGYGVYINLGASTNLIGVNSSAYAPSDGANTISGNALSGVYINGTQGNVVAGNYIGTNATFSAYIGNSQDGVLIGGGAQSNLVGVNNVFGRESSVQSNFIDCNSGNGVHITGWSTTGNTVAGNYIGTQSNCTSQLGNSQGGVRIDDSASSNLIGGSRSVAAVDPLMANTIAFNGFSPAAGQTGAGVAVVSDFAVGNSIIGNSIFQNHGLGIDLGDDGPTENGQLGYGPNNWQNYPTVTGVVRNSNSTTTISGMLESTAGTTFRIELFSNPESDSWYAQGIQLLADVTLLGDVFVTTDATGKTTFEATVLGYPQNITTTATSSNGDTSEFGSFGLDLLVDTNRDNDITAADETGKDQWSATSGAIILDNSNIDSSTGTPQNWPGGYFGGVNPNTGVVSYYAPNNTVDTANINEIGPLWLNQLGTTNLPPDLVVTLSVSEPTSEPPYYASMNPADLVRIFLPTDNTMLLDPGSYYLTTGDQGIIYPDVLQNGSDQPVQSAQFVTNAGPGQFSNSIFAGYGSIHFGIEGIVPGALVNINVKVTVDGTVMASDQVLVKVSPFVLSDNTEHVPIGAGAPPTTVFVASDSDFISTLDEDYGAALNTAGPAVTGGGAWVQDGVAIGYTQAPYGQMPMVLELTTGASMAPYAEGIMAQTNVGIYTGLPSEAAQGTPQNQDSGGDIEALPNPSGGPDYLVCGTGMSSLELNFFQAQGVNQILPVNTNWLLVGHVDEIVSPASDGRHIDVADPELAYGLLLWANTVDPNAPMSQDMNLYGGAGAPVSTVLNDWGSFNVGSDAGAGDPMAPGNLPLDISTIAAATNSTYNDWGVTPSLTNGRNRSCSPCNCV